MNTWRTFLWGNLLADLARNCRSADPVTVTTLTCPFESRLTATYLARVAFNRVPSPLDITIEGRRGMLRAVVV